MQFLKVQVKPLQGGKNEIRLWARDDAGHILTAVAVSPSLSDVATVVQGMYNSLATVGATVTEEEGFQPKIK